jgi:hypothetical protein
LPCECTARAGKTTGSTEAPTEPLGRLHAGCVELAAPQCLQSIAQLSAIEIDGIAGDRDHACRRIS